MLGVERANNQLRKLFVHPAICDEAPQIAWCADANLTFASHSSRFSASEWSMK